MAQTTWTNEAATDRSGNRIPGILKRTSSDGQIQYQVRVRLKGHPTQTATFGRLTDARRWMESTKSAVREGRHFKSAEARAHTLAEAIDRYVEVVVPRKGDYGQKQARMLAWWRARIGAYSLSSVTPAMLAEARDQLLSERTPTGQRRSPSTAVRYMAAMSHVFSVAVKEWGWLDDNPLRRVDNPREPRGRVRFLSEEERDRLLVACAASQNPYLHTVVVLALSTGMRQGEIMNLRWADVDLERRRLVLHETKNGERRAVPLVGPALEALRVHAVGAEPGGLLFPSKVNPAKPMDLRTPWETVLRHAEIEDFRFHDLRHTAASYLAMSGASLAEIAEVLGHKTLSMVKRYAHLSEGHTASVLERMNTKFLGR